MKQTNRAWVHPDGDRPHIHRRVMSDKKAMVIVGVTFDGKFKIELVENRKAVDSEIYCEFLKSAFANFRRRTSVRTLEFEEGIIQPDNATIYRSGRTSGLIEEK